MRAVSAMQAAGHDRPHGTGSIVPALAKNARTGHPQFRNGNGKLGRLGHPSGDAGGFRGPRPRPDRCVAGKTSGDQGVEDRGGRENGLRSEVNNGDSSVCPRFRPRTRAQLGLCRETKRCVGSVVPALAKNGRVAQPLPVICLHPPQQRVPRPCVFCKGGYGNAGSCEATQPDCETKSRSIPDSREPGQILREGRSGNCSIAIAQATPPIRVSPDCGACTAASRPASSLSKR